MKKYFFILLTIKINLPPEKWYISYVTEPKYKLQGGPNIAESFLATKFGNIIWGTPFVLGAYITGIILAKNGDFA